MTIQKIECFTIKCDTCDNDIENMDGFTPHFSSEGDAEEDAQESDWTVWNNHHWCESCGAPSCTCSHLFGEHDQGEAECENCGCIQYEPESQEGR